MAPYVFETSMGILNFVGFNDASIVDPLRNELSLLSGTAYDLQPLSLPPPGPSAYANVASGATKFMWGQPFDSGVVGDALIFGGMPFGMESYEVMSWWYQGGGAAVFAAQLLAAAEDVVMFPMPRFGEGTGWFKEAITHKKLLEGKYATNEAIKFRIFGDGANALNLAYPNVATPAATPNVSFLNDVFGGNYTAGEFADVLGETDLVGGLFPNWPTKVGSIVEALGGSPHYYPGSWHTPARILCLWVNKTFYDALPAQDKQWIYSAAKSHAMEMMSQALQAQDALLTIMQDLGVTVHTSLPINVLDRLRDASDEALDAAAAADGTGAYSAIVTSMRDWMIKNQFRQYAMMDRRYRIETNRKSGDTPESLHFQPDTYF